jgi:predicted ATP-dependent endonuclease of OLD family
MLEVLAAQTATIAAAEGQPSRTRRTVLLFEEPELFMHPHLMRRLKDVLVKIAGRPDWQVVVTTHSPFLVDVASDPCSLVIHRRSDPKQPPKVRQLEKDPFEGKMLERERLRALLDFHPTVCEAFFARHAVLVEGDTEIAVLTRQDVLLKLAGIPADDQRAPTIVSCDGKWTIIPIARLLKEFKIDTRAIHDVDKKEKTPAELEADKAHEFHANAAILEVLGADNVRPIDDTFEHVLWTDGDAPKSKKDKPYRAWKRVRELCNGKENLDHAPQLRDVVKFAYRPA